MFRAQMEDSGNKFARDIKTYPDPAILLASDRQLKDVSRFCCDPFESCILTIDPTFSLGNFDVTPATYRNLLLQSVRTGKPPVMIGPILIHYKKDFQTYLFFASSLLGQNKDLERLHAFGTDGEKALIDAFSHEFHLSRHLTCFIHVRRNIKDELNRCGVPEEVRRSVLDDVFGKTVGTTFVEGLVDAEDDEDFKEKLDFLIDKWSKDESCAPFCSWFTKNKTDVIRRSMLKPVREEAGLGNPPERFYTNASETVNSMLNAVGYKRSELGALITKLKEVCEEQEHEVEMAVLQRGKYRFRLQYQHLVVSEAKRFSMSRDQRMQHLKAINSQSVSDVTDPKYVAFSSDVSGLTITEECAERESVPSVSSIVESLKPLESSLGLPIVALEGIAHKRVEALETPNGIVPAPGFDNLVRMVMSKSGRRSHMVTPKKNGSMACDTDCPHLKSAGVCSHVIGAAIHTNRLSQVISALTKGKRSPNFHMLAVTEMPKGRGRKGGKPPSKRKCSAPVEARISMSCDASPPASMCVVNAAVVNSFNRTSAVASMNNPYTPIPSYPPSYPAYPSYASPPGSMDQAQHPFRVHFVVGNISVRHGCRGGYFKELASLYDLCIQHEEWYSFTTPGSTTT